MGAWIRLAVEQLVASGMVEKYRSRHGNSVYLGWSGRRGVLRVSDHDEGVGRKRSNIYAHVTIREDDPPTSQEALTALCAAAFELYLMRTRHL